MVASPFLALYFSAPSAAICHCFDISKAWRGPPHFSCISQGKHLCQNETKPELLTLRAGHTSTKTTASSGTGDMGSIMTTVGQGHLCPRTLDTAHDYIVSADVSMPVPRFLGRKAEKKHFTHSSVFSGLLGEYSSPCNLHCPSREDPCKCTHYQGDRSWQRMLEQRRRVTRGTSPSRRLVSLGFNPSPLP